jgi:hypothetical protein
MLRKSTAVRNGRLSAPTHSGLGKLHTQRLNAVILAAQRGRRLVRRVALNSRR